MNYFELHTKIGDVKNFAEHGYRDLLSTGFASLDLMIGLKKGFPLFIAGSPGHGKTEFLFELLMNTSILHNWKHFIYCGEGGNIETIYNELLQKYLQRPYKLADEKEKLNAEYFISEHFVIANNDIDFTFDQYYKAIFEAEKELNLRFDTTSFDPFNDFQDEVADQKYLSSVLKKIRISSKVNNRIDILVNHVSDIKPMIDTESKKRYTPRALVSEWAGGKVWERRGFVMLLIYKPPTFLKNENGIDYADNEAIVYIQKSKPKGIGRIGEISIFWDWKKNKYYSYDESGQKLYSCETIESIQIPKMQPNKDFTESINDESKVHT